MPVPCYKVNDLTRKRNPLNPGSATPVNSLIVVSEQCAIKVKIKIFGEFLHTIDALFIDNINY